MKKNQSKKRLILVAVLVTASGAYFFITRSEKTPTVRESSVSPLFSKVPQTFHDIPPEGTGGDPLLNRQKNRWSPPDSIKDVSIAEMFSFAHTDLDVAGKKHREHWSSLATSQAATYEQLGVRVEGYLISAKQSGPESCNGKNDSLRDYHIWIGASPDDKKPNSMVVEMTPYYLELHPEWRLRFLQAYVERHSKVRVSGWVLWDQEHESEVDKSRGSQWEVHPITKFEIYSAGTWVDLGEGVANR